MTEEQSPAQPENGSSPSISRAAAAPARRRGGCVGRFLSAILVILITTFLVLLAGASALIWFGYTPDTPRQLGAAQAQLATVQAQGAVLQAQNSALQTEVAAQAQRYATDHEALGEINNQLANKRRGDLCHRRGWPRHAAGRARPPLGARRALPSAPERYLQRHRARSRRHAGAIATHLPTGSNHDLGAIANADAGANQHPDQHQCHDKHQRSDRASYTQRHRTPPVANCDLRAFADPDARALKERNIRQHPGSRGRLGRRVRF